MESKGLFYDFSCSSCSSWCKACLFLIVASCILLIPLGANGDEGKSESEMEMVFIKGGCFQMGNIFANEENNKKVPAYNKGSSLFGDGNDGEFNDEVPVHEVCVDDFYIGKYEVTIAEFEKFVNETGYVSDAEKRGGCFGKVGYKWRKRRDFNWSKVDFPQTDRHPTVCISYNDTKEFIKWLNEKLVVSEANPSGKYRLPTEAEWEYTARSGGKAEKWAGTNNESELSDYGWYNKNSKGKTHPAGNKKSNGLGLYDMTGNVWEWVQDWYDENYYNSSPKNNPQGPTSGSYHIHRGGSWYFSSHHARITSRHPYTPDYRCYSLGFRFAA